MTEEEKGESVLLSADPKAPFQISPAIGILDPAAEATFSITCNPQNVRTLLNTNYYKYVNAYG